MSRACLIHHNARHADELAARLQSAGHVVESVDLSGEALRGVLVGPPPDVYVIDLDQAPTQGRDVALFLRQRKRSNLIPIVFAGGRPQDVTGVRTILPGAVFSPKSRIGGAIERAVATPPTAPRTPGVLAGYSGTPLPRKLGIKAGSVVTLLGAPTGFAKALGKLPAAVELRRQAEGQAGVIVLFARSVAELARRLPSAVPALADGGRLWIAWPKRKSGLSTDLAQHEVRRAALAAGLVDYKVAAIDAIWSGLCFARRAAAKRSSTHPG